MFLYQKIILINIFVDFNNNINNNYKKILFQKNTFKFTKTKIIYIK